MKFVKMQATGNDFILLDGTQQKLHLSSGIVRKLCDRHYGIGADGIIIVKRSSSTAKFQMRIFNADGSEAEMCGNGIRCLGKFVYEKGLTQSKKISVQTLAGVKKLQLFTKNNKVFQAKVEIGIPEQISNCKLRILNQTFQATLINLDNPHCVIFVRKLEEFPVLKYGPLIENHSFFPNRTNVEFVQVISRNIIKQRTWERGVGETLSCGTGAVAAVAAGIFNQLLNNKVTVFLKGGQLKIEKDSQSNIFYLAGSVKEIFRGELTLKEFSTYFS